MTHDFSAQLAARLCHDLANPLGAIGNGLELLELSGTPATPEMALIQDSLKQANGQLRLMRLAFGPTHHDAGPTAKTTQSMLVAWNAIARMPAAAPETLATTPAEAQMITLCLMSLENALPAGGAVELEKTKTGWTFHATGRLTREDHDLWAHILTPGGNAPPPSSRLHFEAAGTQVAAMGLKASVTFTDVRVTLTLSR